MTLYIWRHPRPLGAAGLCLGRTDLGVDPRKLRRLANRIQRFARRHRLPREIRVSPLQRSLGVGRILARRGWHCRVDSGLVEVDFGGWDGRPWRQIAKRDIDAWCADFAGYAPGDGESLTALFARVAGWLHALPATPVLAVGHAGWIGAARLLSGGGGVPARARDWPAPVRYLQLSLIPAAPAAPAPPHRGSC
ncbi:phosphoglycerate mutase [Zobellella endophytica]|uniref:Phosphoglycerate mutase n=1 Tax=Zobellella endophytica TaxID=2116700 RepID=A0A2P7R614_9GAMM|nr:histidine phosphatase family protein [Zobellella endophytica]PSJ45632.1 phosphoglycerate mutase [Zobellella endophytica]